MHVQLQLGGHGLDVQHHAGAELKQEPIIVEEANLNLVTLKPAQLLCQPVQ